jgi:hypothetical protein
MTASSNSRICERSSHWFEQRKTFFKYDSTAARPDFQEKRMEQTVHTIPRCRRGAQNDEENRKLRESIAIL